MTKPLDGTLFRAPHVVEAVQEAARQRVAELHDAARQRGTKPTELRPSHLRPMTMLEHYRRIAAGGTNVAAERRVALLEQQLGIAAGDE